MPILEQQQPLAFQLRRAHHRLPRQYMAGRTGQQEFIAEQGHGFHTLRRKRQRQQQYIQLTVMQRRDQVLAEILADKQLKCGVLFTQTVEQPRQNERRYGGNNTQAHFARERLGCRIAQGHKVFHLPQQILAAAHHILAQSGQQHLPVVALHQ